MEISSEMAAKVHDLLEANAVCLVVGYENRAAVVNGRTGWYCIRCTRDGVTCDCEAGLTGAVCSHSLAAQAVWADAITNPFSGVMPVEVAFA